MFENSQWCRHYCADHEFPFLCWSCNNMACLCCECFVTSEGVQDCYSADPSTIACSQNLGCC